MVELGATKLSRLVPISRRAATDWLSGKRRPSKLAQARLDELGIVVREPLPPRRPPKGGRPGRYRVNSKVPLRAQAEERAALARLAAME
jgi:hypothetical protein